MVSYQWSKYIAKKKRLAKRPTVFRSISEDDDPENKMPHDMIKSLTRKWNAKLNEFDIDKKKAQGRKTISKPPFLSTPKLHEQLEIISDIRNGNYIEIEE